MLTIDGGTGDVIVGEVPLVPPQIDENFETLLGWADEIRRLRVRANADTPEDAAKAREFGAEGIGLCRTEHMFMAEERLPLVRAMIMASSEEERREALDQPASVPAARTSRGSSTRWRGLPVTIRLLDPPLHEFLPPLEEAESEEMARRIRCAPRGQPDARDARLPARAPLSRDLRDAGARDRPRRPRRRRAERQSRRSSRSCTRWSASPRSCGGCAGSRSTRRRPSSSRARRQLDYLIGTMIELPRACLRADEIAAEADFFSFGTNDLTQTTLGFSRDDAEGKFLTRYLEDRILETNPFETLDVGGVGDLMRIAVERARGVEPEIKLGICGEHGGDARSVAFCHELGLAYVSCSPVPGAARPTGRRSGGARRTRRHDRPGRRLAP